MQPEVWRCTSPNPDPRLSIRTNRQGEASSPPAPLCSASLSLSKSPATCSGESTLSFAAFSFLLSDSTRAASIDSPPPPSVSSAVPYDNSRQAHRSPEFITTFKVAARRSRCLHLLVSSLSCRNMHYLSTVVHFVSVR